MSEENKYYTLRKLPYDYKDLEPYMSEEQLRIHHTKHHQAYVDGANGIFKKLEVARKEGTDLDMKATLKELSFNIGGRLLHSLFWVNLAPKDKRIAKPGQILGAALDKEFGGFDRFKKEFVQAATSVEGSGWAALTYCTRTQRPIIMQIEKHNNNVYPMFRILMVLDLFEHAYYIDYKNDRAKYIESFWNIVNWETVGKRLEKVLK
jgi:Fe-Mn family superoxide dismutase